MNFSISFAVNGDMYNIVSQIKSFNFSVLQACEYIGIEIPRFCYHRKLSIAGNCRMCLVELSKAPKPVAACALPLSSGMNIFTETKLVKRAREGVLEFLLLNHPLDCPICDQGGECDLQDQVFMFGRREGFRFYSKKRAVTNKKIGVLIKTVMNRCIHCTRCVRFLYEIAGSYEFGVLGRGNNTEISTYIMSWVGSPLSGNLIDICPVGALTSKPYTFYGRPWELSSYAAIDFSDALGTHITVECRNNMIARIGPRLCDAINGEWLHDRARFSYDNNFTNRLQDSHVNSKFSLLQSDVLFVDFRNNCNFTQNKLMTHEVYAQLIRFDHTKTTMAVLGGSLDLYSVLNSYNFFNRLGVGCEIMFMENSVNTVDFGFFFRNNGLYASTFCKNTLVVGVNMLVELPLILAKWFNSFQKNKLLTNNLFAITIIGPQCDTAWISGTNFTFAGQIGISHFMLNSFLFGTTRNCQTFLGTNSSSAVVNAYIYSFFFHLFSSFTKNVFWGYNNMVSFTMYTATCSAYEYGLGFNKYKILSSNNVLLKLVCNQVSFNSPNIIPFIFFFEANDYLHKNFEFSEIFKSSYKLFYTTHILPKIDCSHSSIVVAGLMPFEHTTFHINNEGRVQTSQQIIQTGTMGTNCTNYFKEWLVRDFAINNLFFDMAFEQEFFGVDSNFELGKIPTMQVMPQLDYNFNFCVKKKEFTNNLHINYQWSCFYNICTLSKESTIMAKCREKKMILSYSL